VAPGSGERDAARGAIEEAGAEPILESADGFIIFSNPDALEAATKAGRRAIAAVKDPEVRRRLTPVARTRGSSSS